VVVMMVTMVMSDYMLFSTKISNITFSCATTMAKVVIDLQGCTGTEQPYVMISRSTSLQGLVILREFDFGKITKRPSEDLRMEFARLEVLRLETVAKYGSGDEEDAANVKGEEKF
jgi:hypothetical protein